MKLRLLMASAALVAMTLGARADVTREFDITGSDFSLVFVGSGDTPIDPATLDVTVTWDPSASFGPTTSGVTVNSFNLPYTVAASGVSGFLVLASYPLSDGGGCYNPGSSFCIFVQFPASESRWAATFFEQSPADGSYWVAQNVTANASPGTPEPSTWAMMLLGFAGVGFAWYRRVRRGHATLAA
jgi:hypothetical protein